MDPEILVVSLLVREYMLEAGGGTVGEIGPGEAAINASNTLDGEKGDADAARFEPDEGTPALNAAS